MISILATTGAPTSTRIAPWYVIPGDHKWYARLAVQELLVRTLEGINPTWPQADFDVDAAKDRLSASLTPEVLSSHAHEKSGDAGSQDKNEGASKSKKSKKFDKKKSDASASQDAPHISVSAWG